MYEKDIQFSHWKLFEFGGNLIISCKIALLNLILDCLLNDELPFINFWKIYCNMQLSQLYWLYISTRKLKLEFIHTIFHSCLTNLLFLEIRDMVGWYKIFDTESEWCIYEGRIKFVSFLKIYIFRKIILNE